MIIEDKPGLKLEERPGLVLEDRPGMVLEERPGMVLEEDPLKRLVEKYGGISEEYLAKHKALLNKGMVLPSS